MILDCRDMDCPRPVLETKKALDALPSDAILTVEVNTLSGRENCKRFALSQHCTFSEETLSDGATRLVITKGNGYVERPEEENPLDALMEQERRSAVYVLSGALITALLICLMLYYSDSLYGVRDLLCRNHQCRRVRALPMDFYLCGGCHAEYRVLSDGDQKKD